MSRIMIDNEDEAVTEIAWTNKDGDIESILNSDGYIKAGLQWTYREDIPKLIKALEKAKELGWWE